MILGIAGRIGSGKDTVGRIIQILTNSPHFTNEAVESFLDREPLSPSFKIKKFADSLKEMAMILLGCTRAQLEDQNFKNTPLGPEWNFKELHRERRVITLDPENKYPHIGFKQMTPRLLLQLLGTECGRDILHPNVWVNALFSKYKEQYTSRHTLVDPAVFGDEPDDWSTAYPNWIITDMRFPNELQAVVDREGITIRVIRGQYYGIQQSELGQSIFHIWSDTEDRQNNTLSSDVRYVSKHESWVEFMKMYPDEHISETALDTERTTYTIYNNGKIVNLIADVRRILINEKIINEQ